MPKSRTPGASPSRKSTARTERSAHLSPIRLRTAERAHLLIEAMLKEMQLGLQNPSHCTTEEWDKLFGSKQSMVANLQKLVAALMALPEPLSEAQPQTSQDVGTPLSSEEMELLKAWLSEK